MMKRCVVLLFVIYTTFKVVHLKQLPTALHICKPNDDHCLKSSIESLRPLLKNGMRDMHIPNLNPFKLPLIQLRLAGFSVNYTDVEVTNLFNFAIREIQSKHNDDANNVALHMKLEFNDVTLSSDFDVAGTLIVLNLDGDGSLKVFYENSDAILDLSAKQVMKEDGRRHLRVSDMRVKTTLNKARLEAENLIRDNPALTRSAVQVINENVPQFWEAIGGHFDDVAAQTLRTTIDFVFDKWSYDELFQQ